MQIEPETEVCLIRFRQSFTQQLREQLLTPKLLLELNRTKLFLEYQELSQALKIIRLLPYIEELKNEYLYLGQNAGVHILKELSFLIYSNLISLDLGHNGVENIEIFAFMNMEKLKFISISGNPISHIKSLNKARWPHVSEVDLGRYSTIHVDLTRMKMSENLMRLATISVSRNIKIMDDQRVNCIKLEPVYINKYFYKKCLESTSKVVRMIARSYLPSQCL